MAETIRLIVNGTEQEVQVDPVTPLLYVLRDELELNGPKYGCGLNQCGSCMVLLDGEAQTTCRLPVSAAAGREVTTLRGLTDGDELHPVQEAFVEEQAAQCGYCVNGMIVSAVALLTDTPNPTPEEIRNGLRPVLCRCGTHARFVRAVQRAADA